MLYTFLKHFNENLLPMHDILLMYGKNCSMIYFEKLYPDVGSHEQGEKIDDSQQYSGIFNI